MRNLLVVIPSLALLGCGDAPAPSAADQRNDTLTTAASATDLAQYDLPLQVILPDARALAGAEPTLGWNEEEGWFGARAGDHFSLHITEEPGDMPRLKRDLENDLLRKHTVLTDRPDLLIYRSDFPDDPSLVQVHFYRVMTVGERTFVIESDPEGRFNEADVERMIAAVSAKTPA
jgi:hypothetical protein